LEPIEEEKVADGMACAKCGKEILDKESSFCAYCGASFDTKSSGSGLTIGAGVLAMVAAVFSVAVGFMGVNYYQTYIAYCASYGVDASGSFGFLLFASFAFVSSALGFAGGALALTKKRFMFSVTGMLVMLASALFTFVSLWRFGYGFIEGLLLPGISIIGFSILSTVFATRSRKEFS